MSTALADRPGEREHPGLDGLIDRVARAAGVLNAAEAALVDLAAEALREGLWTGAGVHSPTQWLMWRAGLSRAMAAQVVRLARRAAELPTTMRLHAEGRLSLDQASAIARFVPAAYEASVCELAVNATVPQIVAATRQYEFDLDRADREAAAAAAGEPARRAPERSVAYGCDDGDQWSARVRLPVDEGVVVQAALEAVRDRLHSREREAAKEAAAVEGRSPAGTDAELGVTRVDAADALVEMARSTLADTSRASTPADVASRAGLLVHLEVPVDGSDDHWRATLHRGPVLPASLRRFLSCDADVGVVWERKGVPLATSRTQRTVPARLRRLVEHRDGGCVVPGCDVRHGLQVHHVVHWEDGGETTSSNLALVCGRDHRLHHAGGLGISGDADVGLVFTDQWGRRLPSAGRPEPPAAGDLPWVAPYNGPTGERLQRKWVSFTRMRAPDEPAP